MKPIYQDLWNRAVAAYRSNQVVLDPYLPGKVDDTRQGLTLCCRLPEPVVAEVQAFLQDFSRTFPGQYAYPASDLHLTVLTLISCQSDFSLADSQWPEYAAIIEACLRDLPPLEMTFDGITASPSCLLLQSFPRNEVLETIRSRLRAAFADSGLSHTIDQRYFLNTAHSTLLRFVQAPADPEAMISHLLPYRDYDFGQGRISQLELVCTDWYMSTGIAQQLRQFPLGE